VNALHHSVCVFVGCVWTHNYQAIGIATKVDNVWNVKLAAHAFSFGHHDTVSRAVHAVASERLELACHRLMIKL